MTQWSVDEGGCEEKTMKLLNRLIGKEHVVLVGHMPHLGELAAYCVGDTVEKPIELKKGGMAKIHFRGFPAKGGGRLRWVMSSEELKTSGRNDGTTSNPLQ